MRRQKLPQIFGGQWNRRNIVLSGALIFGVIGLLIKFYLSASFDSYSDDLFFFALIKIAGDLFVYMLMEVSSEVIMLVVTVYLVNDIIEKQAEVERRQIDLLLDLVSGSHQRTKDAIEKLSRKPGNWHKEPLFVRYADKISGSDIANFEGLTLNGFNFTGAKLPDSKFSGATLKSVIFQSADLTGADFSNANFEGVDFIETSLKGCSLLIKESTNVTFPESNDRFFDTRTVLPDHSTWTFGRNVDSEFGTWTRKMDDNTIGIADK